MAFVVASGGCFGTDDPGPQPLPDPDDFCDDDSPLPRNEREPPELISPEWEFTELLDYSQWVEDVAVDNNGDIVAAMVHNPSTFPDRTCFRLAKYSSSGDVVFDKRVASTFPDSRPCLTGEAVAIDANNNIVVAGTSSSPGGALRVFVAKYNPDGDEIWTTEIGAGLGTSVAIDSSSNIIAAGGSGTPPSVVAKLDSDGGLLWSNELAVFPRELALFADDEIAMASSVHEPYTEGGASLGHALDRLSADGDIVWSTSDLDVKYTKPTGMTFSGADVFVTLDIGLDYIAVRRHAGGNGDTVWTLVSEGAELHDLMFDETGTGWAVGMTATPAPEEERCSRCDRSCIESPQRFALLQQFSAAGESLAIRAYDGAGTAFAVALLPNDRAFLAGSIFKGFDNGDDREDAWLGVVALPTTD